eukprot:TRINITY_DN46075_c0_g2_i1.p1 TRINITY_DN46075_c0_g2~~TRINITY_DN46075_c0_g2_i1.p1  ORF type:complete len:264 (-),score=26.18 TRINITY_DN46075_c0_g2_i1:47-838(-)
MCIRDSNAVNVHAIGDPGTGKSAFCERMCKGTFSPHESVVKVDSSWSIREVRLVNSPNINLMVWDHPRDSRYETVQRNLIRKAQLLFVLYDITDHRTFEELEKRCEWAWEEVSQPRRRTGSAGSESGLPGPRSVIALVGCKRDQAHHREVDTEEGVELAEQLSDRCEQKVHFAECSSKTGEGVEALALRLLTEFVQNNDLPEAHNSSSLSRRRATSHSSAGRASRHRSNSGQPERFAPLRAQPGKHSSERPPGGDRCGHCVLS